MTDKAKHLVFTFDANCTGHYLVLGPIRSGKSTSVVIDPLLDPTDLDSSLQHYTQVSNPSDGSE